MAPLASTPKTLSAADFDELLLDQPIDGRWELIGGRVVHGQVGAAWEHKQIVLNCAFALNTQLRAMASPCRAYEETFRLRVDALNLNALPDVVVFCQSLAQGAVALDDAAVVIEVTSPGTEARDRLEKWLYYQQLPGLKHYALIMRDRISIEIYTRADKGWDYARLDRTSDRLTLTAIDCEIPVAEIYAGVIAADT